MKLICYSKMVSCYITPYCKTLSYAACFVALCLFSLNLRAQVTIGMSDNPKKGALLDLREYNPQTPGDATATHGVIFPRVDLVGPTTLEPLLSAQDSSDPTRRANHKGAVVYNVTVNADFKEGLYFWDGAQWIPIGASLNTYWETAGNAKTDSTVNFIGTADATPLIINTDNKEVMRISKSGKTGIKNDQPKTELDVNGQLSIKNVPVLNSGNPQTLYINDDGLIGLQPSVITQTAAPIFFAYTYDIQVEFDPSVTNGFNTGKEILIPLGPINLRPTGNRGVEVKVNNIGINTTSPKSEYFEITTAGVYQIAFSMNIAISGDVGNKMVVNARIEKEDGSGSMETLISTRLTAYLGYKGNQYSGQGTTVDLPVTVSSFEAGDRIRVYFSRAKDENGNMLGNNVRAISVVGDRNNLLLTYSLMLKKL
ncbi:MAG: hypothetical protein LBH32_10720 [Dysgonamonadaceae bacterium]|jgi:hypothetical protein|nr:hypothetical protein [Dysgonamonadaceae bacterium]